MHFGKDLLWPGLTAATLLVAVTLATGVASGRWHAASASSDEALRELLERLPTQLGPWEREDEEVCPLIEPLRQGVAGAYRLQEADRSVGFCVMMGDGRTLDLDGPQDCFPRSPLGQEIAPARVEVREDALWADCLSGAYLRYTAARTQRLRIYWTLLRGNDWEAAPRASRRRAGPPAVKIYLFAEEPAGSADNVSPVVDLGKRLLPALQHVMVGAR